MIATACVDQVSLLIPAAPGRSRLAWQPRGSGIRHGNIENGFQSQKDTAVTARLEPSSGCDFAQKLHGSLMARAT
jgi:hypothetical protein